MALTDLAVSPRRTAGFRSGFGPVRGPSTPQGAGYNTDLAQWARQTVEKVRVATVGGRIRFLPWYDPYTDETPEIRAEYPKMLVESTVKAAFQTKIFSVISLDVQCQPVDDDDPRQKAAAQFGTYQFRKIRGGMRRVGWSVLHPAVIGGHSVCEKVWRERPEADGPFRGKRIYHAVKAKDTRFLQLGIDPYRNITAIRGMGHNAGRVWSPSDFIIFSYMELFENPAGTSDFRAAYRPYWIKHTTWQLRGLHLDKFVGPYLKGTYTTQDQKDALEAALAQARATTWMTCPIGTAVEAIDMSMRGTADFEQAIKDCDREILIAIVGAHLQILEGQTTGGRGNTKVHKETAELIQWFLAASLADIYREQLIAPLIEENFHGVEPPDVTVGAVTEEAMLDYLKVDQGLQALGLELSKRDAYKRYSRAAPEADDVLAAPAPAPAAPAKGGVAGQASPFSERWRQFCTEGKNKGMPGPCPEEKDKNGVSTTRPATATDDPAYSAEHRQVVGGKPEATTADGTRVHFVMHSGMQGGGPYAPRGVMIMVDVEKLDRALPEGERIETGGGGPIETAGKREGFKQFLKTGAEVESPDVQVDQNGVPRIADGRHRFSVLRDLGVKTMPVTIYEPMAERLIEHFGTDLAKKEWKAARERAAPKPEAAPALPEKKPGIFKRLKNKLFDETADFCTEGANKGKPGPCPEGQDKASTPNSPAPGLGVIVPYSTPIHAQVDKTLQRARQRLEKAGSDPLKAGAVRLQAAEQLERVVHNRVFSLLSEFKQQYPGLESGREFKEAVASGRQLKSAAWALGHTLGTAEEPKLQAEYRGKLADFQAKVVGLSRKARLGLSETSRFCQEGKNKGMPGPCPEGEKTATHVPVYRGFPDPEHAHSMRRGEFHIGQGDYGRGTYLSTDPYVAESYATAGDAEGEVVHASIVPGAHIATAAQVEQLHRQAVESGKIKADLDLGTFARQNGIDAISVPHKWIMNVVNPAVLRLTHPLPSH